MKVLGDNAREKVSSNPSKMPITKPTSRKRINILTPKQILQILPIEFAQVKAGNTTKALLNEILLFIDLKKLLKKHVTYNQFNADII